MKSIQRKKRKDKVSLSKEEQYRIIMNFYDLAHYIYMDKIKKIEFSRISSYKNSKPVFDKLYNDFSLVYELLDRGNIINSATILRQIYENIIYIIATSCEDDELKVTIKTLPRDYQKVIKKHANELALNELINGMIDTYEYLCKIVHPCSMKEIFSLFESDEMYSKYICNVIYFNLVTIEYMLIKFANKKYKKEDGLVDDIFVTFFFTYFYNEKEFVELNRKDIEFLKFCDNFFKNDRESEFVKKKMTETTLMLEILKANNGDIERMRDIFLPELAKKLESSEYKDSINDFIYKDIEKPK